MKIDPIKASLRDISTGTIRMLISGVEEGRMKLHIPLVRHQFDVSKGPHFHLLPELFIQVSGISRMEFPDEAIKSLPEAILIVPRGVPHEEFAQDYRGPFCNLVFAYGREDLHLHAAYMGEQGKPQAKKFEIMATDSSIALHRHLDEIVAIKERDHNTKSLAIKGLLLAHLVCLLDCLTRPAPRQSSEPLKIGQCRQLILQHLAMPELSVRHLAQLIACSPDYLSNLFCRSTGVTITKYINNLRIQQARTLLEDSTMNISEIAWACGYSDPGYFARLFIRATSRSPKAYRRGLRRPE